MLLAVDIGNTNISLGIFLKNNIIKKFDIPTKIYSLNKLKKGLGKTKIDDAIVCSVVPCVTKGLEKDLKEILGKAPYIIGKNASVPIKNLYRKQKQVGQDRLANAYAGVILYGAPLIIVDFGTAITFDVISKRKEYLGGMILPGLNISLAALFENTALLPRIKLVRPRELIGKDTRNSMLSGIIYGFSSLTDGLITKLKSRVKGPLRTIGTGGNIGLIKKYCKHIDIVDDEITLKGLGLIYNRKPFLLQNPAT